MGKISELIAALKGNLSVFKKTPPVDDCAGFHYFLATRAAFIAQKTLYGYVKTRMGMKYPMTFQEPLFIESLNIAKWQVYNACLSDLAVYMAAHVFAKTADKKLTDRLAKEVFTDIINDRFSVEEFTGDKSQLISDFEKRLALIEWKNMVGGENAFKLSPAALIRWAPIDDSLKKYDVEIVKNSIRFQWQRIRSDFQSAFQVDSFLVDWHKNFK